MSKIAEQKALEEYPILFSERNGYDSTFKDRRESYIKGYDQAMQDFLERACVSFCKQCPWRCKYDITQGEYCKNLHDFKQILIQE